MLRARRYAAPVILALAFATFVQLCVVLAGRLPAGPLACAFSLGVLAVALIATPGPLRRVRSLGRGPAATAAAGGLLAVLGAPALVVGLRMSDAPAGSIVVFLMSGGWAAVAALAGAVVAVRSRRMEASWTVSGALLVLAGAAGVVANWERPSSFSPFVRFPVAEAGILLGGIALIAGGLLLVRVARASDPGGALMVAAAAASATGLVWWGASGFAAGWSSLAEQPLAVSAAAVAWGLVCLNWIEVLRRHGPPVAAACLALTPLLLPLLSVLEQLVGVAGPQPLVVNGVIAGALVCLAGCAALLHAARARTAAGARLLPVAAGVPLAASVGALMLPAIAVSVAVTVTGGRFAGSWTLSGAESIIGWAVVALAVLVFVAAFDAAPAVPAAVALTAFAALPWLADVPTHVWSATLAPEIQQYYGTEYGSIDFTAVPNILMIVAAALAMVALLAIMAVRRAPGAAATDNGGSKTPCDAD